MFDQLFKTRFARARHRGAPLLEERLAFLTQLANRGLSRICLCVIAQQLLVFTKMFAVVKHPARIFTRDEVKRKTGDHQRFSVATRWLRFLRRLEERSAPVSPYADKIKGFADY